MAITSVGFKGTVGQSEDARRWGRIGPRFTVGGAAELLCSPGSGDRRVQIATGSAQAGAVTATSDALAYVDLPANATGQTRYDLIILRYVWTDPVTQPVLTYVKGVDGSSAPNVGALIRTLGTQYDGVLAVVRVASGQGTLNANDIFDVRMWAGVSGPLISAGIAYLSVRDTPIGTELQAASIPARLTRVAGWADAAIDGTAVPAGAWIAQLRASRVSTVANAGGGTNLPFGATFTKLISVIMAAGDAAADLAYVIPIVANHTGGSAHGAAYRANGTPVIQGNPVRVELDVLAYIA